MRRGQISRQRIPCYKCHEEFGMLQKEPCGWLVGGKGKRGEKGRKFRWGSEDHHEQFRCESEKWDAIQGFAEMTFVVRLAFGISLAGGHAPGADVKINQELTAITRTGGDGGLASGSGDEYRDRQVDSRGILEVESLQPEWLGQRNYYCLREHALRLNVLK